jgi:hypothetical protein
VVELLIRLHVIHFPRKGTEMKKIAFLFMATLCFCTLSLTGCSGGGESTVIEAPPEVLEEQPAIEGMTDEDYDQAMDEEMNQ